MRAWAQYPSRSSWPTVRLEEGEDAGVSAAAAIHRLALLSGPQFHHLSKEILPWGHNLSQSCLHMLGSYMFLGVLVLFYSVKWAGYLAQSFGKRTDHEPQVSTWYPCPASCLLDSPLLNLDLHSSS